MYEINDKFIEALEINATTTQSNDILSDAEITLLEKTTKSVAGSIILATKEGASEGQDVEKGEWLTTGLSVKGTFFIYPEGDSDKLYTISNPIAKKVTNDPESLNYTLNGKVLGLISSLVALGVIEKNLALDINRRKNEKRIVARFFGKSAVEEINISHIKKFKSNLRQSVKESFEVLLNNETLTNNEKAVIDHAYNAVFLCVDNLR